MNAASFTHNLNPVSIGAPGLNDMFEKTQKAALSTGNARIKADFIKSRSVRVKFMCVGPFLSRYSMDERDSMRDLNLPGCKRIVVYPKP